MRLKLLEISVSSVCTIYCLNFLNSGQAINIKARSLKNNSQIYVSTLKINEPGRKKKIGKQNKVAKLFPKFSAARPASRSTDSGQAHLDSDIASVCDRHVTLARSLL